RARCAITEGTTPGVDRLAAVEERKEAEAEVVERGWRVARDARLRIELTHQGIELSLRESPIGAMRHEHDQHEQSHGSQGEDAPGRGLSRRFSGLWGPFVGEE